MANRYALCMEHPYSRTVFDDFTGQPVELKHQVMVGKSPDPAARFTRHICAPGSGSDLARWP
jgi:hypothetical protein